MTADDLRRIRFPLAVRGYRMAEVDALLERLAEEREAADRAAPDGEAPTARPPARQPGLPRTEGDTDPSASAH